MNMSNGHKETKKIKRKKFFSQTGKGIAGLLLLSSFPLKLFAGKKKRRVEIKLNPQAVGRNKNGRRNG